MTQKDHDAASNDLAYVRAIAEEGRNAPLTGGLMFVWWGSVIGLAALVQYVSDIGLVKWPVDMLWRWTIALAIGWGAGFWVERKFVTKIPGGTTFGNKTSTAAWAGVGIFMTVYFLGLTAALFIMKDKGFPIEYLFGSMFPVVFGLFGVTYLVTSVAANLQWMRNISIVSWVLMVAMIFSLNSSHGMLLGALGCFALMVVPGLILMRQQPTDVI